MWVKSIIEKEARKIVNHPYYSNGRLLSTTIFLYLIMVMSVLTIIEMSYDMYFVKYDFDALVREQVVEQRAFINAKSKRPEIWFKTESGYEISRGQYALGFDLITKAIEDNAYIEVWIDPGSPFFVSSYLKDTTVSPFQVSVNGKVVIPFEMYLQFNQRDIPFIFLFSLMILLAFLSVIAMHRALEIVKETE